MCLGKEFSGATLSFCGNMGEPHHRHLSHTYEHRKGHCVVHLGKRRHGADDIASGERLNLIVWNHNLAYRASKAYNDLQHQRRYLQEAGPPDAVCLSYTHDRDYLQYKAPPAAAAKMSRRAWCPPLFARHDGAPPLHGGGAPRNPRRAKALSDAIMSDEGFEVFEGASDEDGEVGIEQLRELQSEVQSELEGLGVARGGDPADSDVAE